MPAGFVARDPKGSRDSDQVSPPSSEYHSGLPMRLFQEKLSPPRKIRPVGVLKKKLARVMPLPGSRRPVFADAQVRPLSVER